VTEYLLIFAATLVLAIGTTPIARWLAPRAGFIDHPEARRIHKHPVPRLGGAAIYVAVITIALILGRRYNFGQFGAILVGATGMSFMGLVDDRWGLRPLVKMVAQGLAALLLYANDIYVGTFNNPVLNLLTTVLWVGFVTNAVNYQDNMDGLSSGICAIAAAFFALMCAFSGQYLVGALSMAVLAACLGFLVYNLNPASIFMGDSGTQFLGYILAAIGIKLRFPDNVEFVTWMVPVLVMGFPIFDATLVTLSRLRRRTNPGKAGLDHTSHRLLAAGLTQREAVLTIYVVSFVLGLLAIFAMQASIPEGYAGGCLVVLAALYAMWRLDRPPFRALPQRRAAAQDRHAAPGDRHPIPPGNKPGT
jgi:UDP-GlcNAc:undecaprenyl-phosphate GlcNAc-1-phosphate transferase